MPRYILVHSTESTNGYLAKMAMMLPGGTVIYTPNQTNGRGQRGNVWEAEPGKNATFSMLLKRPAVAVSKQYAISEAVALAVVEVLSRYADGFSIKWSNDIYHGDRKVCGLLIEHSVMGAAINHTIVGVGINVNQMQFMSNAPNPASLAQILGHEVPVEEVLYAVCEEIERRCAFDTYGVEDFARLHADFKSRLYRNDGKMYRFALPDGEEFSARIADVQPTGMLVLAREDGSETAYAFKEVQFVI